MKNGGRHRWEGDRRDRSILETDRIHSEEILVYEFLSNTSSRRNAENGGEQHAPWKKFIKVGKGKL